MLWEADMSRPLLIFSVSLLMIFIGVSQLSALTNQAAVAGHGDAVIDDIWSYQRLLTLGVGGSKLASALIARGQDTLIVESDGRSSDADVPAISPST